MGIDQNTSTQPGLSVAALLFGVFVLFALLPIVAGFGGVGTPELVIWILLVVAWVTFWMLKRRR